MTYYDFSTEIRNLAKSEKYSEVLSLLKNNGENFISEISGDKFLIVNLLKSLRKAENGKFATINMLELFLQKYHIQINADNMASYGWFLYDAIKTIYTNKGDSAKINNKILEFIKMAVPMIESDDFIKNAFVFVFKESINTNKDNFNFIIGLCENIPPLILGDKPNIINVNGKDRKILSDKEKYYLAFSGALYKQKDFNRCIKVCKEAFDNIKFFTNGTDIWLKRNMILSQNELNYPVNELIAEFKKLLEKKKDWFMQFDMATLYRKCGDNKKALQYAISAINSFGEMGMKIGYLEFVGDILKSDDERLAKLHYLFVKEIRVKNNWRVESIEAKIESIKYEVGSENIFGELKKYWNTFKNNADFKKLDSAPQVGTITKILHDNDKGKDGFIDKKYYFNVGIKHECHKNIAPNKKVKFEFKTSDDKVFAKIIEVL